MAAIEVMAAIDLMVVMAVMAEMDTAVTVIGVNKRRACSAIIEIGPFVKS